MSDDIDVPQYSRRKNAVQCIRCDDMTNRVKTLYYNHESNWLYLCPSCFEKVKNRGD